MKKSFGDIFKKTNAKKIWQFIFILALGIMLMILGNYAPEGKKKEDGAPQKEEAVEAAGETMVYESELERKLESTLSSVEGVGKVKVLITLSYSGEVELAKDTVKETQRFSDSDGRVTERADEKHVIIEGLDGKKQPVIVKQVEPKIEGVIIVAEGGDSAAIKASLTKAAEALLNLPAHKIEVLKMRG